MSITVGMRLYAEISLLTKDICQNETIIESGSAWTITDIIKNESKVIIKPRYSGREIELPKKVLKQVFGLGPFKATAFRVEAVAESVYIEQKTKTLADAKAFVKCKTGRGTISALIRNQWISVFEYSIEKGFRRVKMFNGMDESNYMRFL